MVRRDFALCSARSQSTGSQGNQAANEKQRWSKEEQRPEQKNNRNTAGTSPLATDWKLLSKKVTNVGGLQEQETSGELVIGNTERKSTRC